MACLTRGACTLDTSVGLGSAAGLLFASAAGADSGSGAQEIDVALNGNSILSGSAIQFGSIAVGTNYDLVFTITNTGPDTLTLQGNPSIGMSGDTSDFQVLQQASSTSLSQGESTTFTIRYAPVTSSAHAALITISNNDSDEDGYSISLTGTGRTGRFVLVGTNCDIRWTEDPTNSWNTPMIPGGCTESLFGVAHANDGGDGTFVAVGTSGRVLYSTDRAQNWTAASAGTTDTLQAVTHGNGHWVIVGSNNVARVASNPAGPWTIPVSITGGTLNAISYGNGTFIAVGSTGQICTTSDPTGSWSCGNPLGTQNWTGATFGAGTFVIAGDSGPIFSSTDGGVTWNNNSTGSMNTRSVGFGNDLFAVSGNESGSTTAPLIYATTAQVNTPTNQFPSVQNITNTSMTFFTAGVSFGNNLWVSGGNGGANDQVFYNTSPDLTNLWAKNNTGAIGTWNRITFED